MTSTEFDTKWFGSGSSTDIVNRLHEAARRRRAAAKNGAPRPWYDDRIGGAPPACQAVWDAADERYARDVAVADGVERLFAAEREADMLIVCPGYAADLEEARRRGII